MGYYLAWKAGCGFPSSGELHRGDRAEASFLKRRESGKDGGGELLDVVFIEFRAVINESDFDLASPKRILLFGLLWASAMSRRNTLPLCVPLCVDFGKLSFSQSQGS